MRIRELEIMIKLIAEESDLDAEWGDADLSEKLALGRRFSSITNQKLRILKLLFQHRAAFSAKSGGKSA